MKQLLTKTLRVLLEILIITASAEDVAFCIGYRNVLIAVLPSNVSLKYEYLGKYLSLIDHLLHVRLHTLTLPRWSVALLLNA